MPCWASAMSDEAPKSIATRDAGPSTTMQVWKRPPLPKESPEPAKRTVTVMVSSSDGEHSTGPLSAISPVLVRADADITPRLMGIRPAMDRLRRVRVTP